MPFRSKKQEGYLWANHPDVAMKYAAETKAGPLPDRVPPIKTAGQRLTSAWEGMARRGIKRPKNLA